jgi:hypothetical protein
MTDSSSIATTAQTPAGVRMVVAVIMILPF